MVASHYRPSGQLARLLNVDKFCQDIDIEGSEEGSKALNITSRSRYALKIMLDLAQHHDMPLVRRSEIVKRQSVPADYLDQIMMRLRSNHLVESVRGRTGGYRLARHPDAISVWDLFSAVEDGFYPVSCVEHRNSCALETMCSSHDAWSDMYAAVRGSLVNIKISDLSMRWNQQLPLAEIIGVHECRGAAAVGKGERYV